jgi:hypothetical protein
MKKLLVIGLALLVAGCVPRVPVSLPRAVPKVSFKPPSVRIPPVSRPPVIHMPSEPLLRPRVLPHETPRRFDGLEHGLTNIPLPPSSDTEKRDRPPFPTAPLSGPPRDRSLDKP